MLLSLGLGPLVLLQAFPLLVLHLHVACSSNLTPLQVRSVTDRFVDGVSDPRLYLSRYFDVSAVAR